MPRVGDRGKVVGIGQPRLEPLEDARLGERFLTAQENGKGPERTGALPKWSLAINVWDLTRLDKTMVDLLLGIGTKDCRISTDKEQAVWVDKDRMDETGVPFVCDLLTAACICDTIRTHDRRVGEHPCRVYLRKAVAWERLPHETLLSIVVDGKCVLNPKVFAGSVAPAEPEPLQPKAWKVVKAKGAAVLECDACDGTGLMEGWNGRDGSSCPKCKGKGVTNG